MGTCMSVVNTSNGLFLSWAPERIQVLNCLLCPNSKLKYVRCMRPDGHTSRTPVHNYANGNECKKDFPDYSSSQ